MTRFIFIVAILVFALCGFVANANAQINVTQKNNDLSRDGLYIDPVFTLGNAANLLRDLNFDGTIVGIRSCAAALHRGRAERPNDHCCYRIE